MAKIASTFPLFLMRCRNCCKNWPDLLDLDLLVDSLIAQNSSKEKFYLLHVVTMERTQLSIPSCNWHQLFSTSIYGIAECCMNCSCYYLFLWLSILVVIFNWAWGNFNRELHSESHASIKACIAPKDLHISQMFIWLKSVIFFFGAFDHKFEIVLLLVLHRSNYLCKIPAYI